VTNDGAASMGLWGDGGAETALDRAHSLLNRHPLVDGHNDLPWAMREAVNCDLSALDLAVRGDRTQTDLVRLQEGRVGAQFWSIYVPSTLTGADAVRQTLEQADFVHELIATYPRNLGLALTATDVESVFRSGRVASLLGAEGGHSMGESTDTLGVLHDHGVRYMTLTHNDNTSWADSATDNPVHGGLSEFGREVVREMNRVGILVDLSHVSPATMHDAMNTTVAPVIMSHSSCRELNDHVRNVPDDVLSRLPDNEGVCMITFVPDFVSVQCREWTESVLATIRAQGLDERDRGVVESFSAQRQATDPKPRATVTQVADHIEHARLVAGIDHVGIGADYDGCADFPVGLDDVASYPYIFAELYQRGWTDSELIKLAGANVLRTLRSAQAVAQSLRERTQRVQ
jgi:membrane dipeptidase